MKIENDDATLQREVSREIFDHEALLSFTDDDMGYAFDIWWNLKGFTEFQKFYETRESF